MKDVYKRQDFMKIIESSIIGKKSQEVCEDGMVITDDFIAVIDGSTSKTPKPVSYTHLDVYKRQTQGCADRMSGEMLGMSCQMKQDFLLVRIFANMHIICIMG